jgi:hypothetical protein
MVAFWESQMKTVKNSRIMLKQYGYIPTMLSQSRFSRRLHRLKETLIVLFKVLGQTWKTLNTDSIYAIDSFPVSVCDNLCTRQNFR